MKELIHTFIKKAEENMNTIMPGYTHMQRAQPVTFAHHLIAYVQMFLRDLERLNETYKRIDVCPIGSCALAGTTYPLACLFGFSDTYESAEKDDPSRCKTINVTNQEKHSYQLMIWLRETGERQDEQGLSFQGTVSLEVPGGVGDSDYENGQITGQQ